MSEFWKRKLRTMMHTLDYDKDGYISEMDYANMGRGFADAYKATPEKRDNLVRAFVNLWRKYMKAVDLVKESRLTLPILIESIKQQLYDPELITCIAQANRGIFELMDVSRNGYLQANDFKVICTQISESQKGDSTRKRHSMQWMATVTEDWDLMSIMQHL